MILETTYSSQSPLIREHRIGYLTLVFKENSGQTWPIFSFKALKHLKGPKIQNEYVDRKSSKLKIPKKTGHQLIKSKKANI